MKYVPMIVLVCSISFAWGYSLRANEDAENVRGAALAVHFEMNEEISRDMRGIGLCAWAKLIAARNGCKGVTHD